MQRKRAHQYYGTAETWPAYARWLLEDEQKDTTEARPLVTALAILTVVQLAPIERVV